MTNPTYGQATVTLTGPVARVSFSRPPNNHVSAELLSDLADAFDAIDADPTLRASVLASEGRIFCAGADFGAGAQETGADRTGFVESLYAQAVRLFAAKKPIVAAIQGAAVGAGLGLSLVADFRVVAHEARFAANFVKLAFHPGFGLTHTLPRLIGPQKAADLFLTGRRVGGEEAVAIGLADRLVPLEGLADAAHALAAEIAENAPLAVVATRATLRAGLAEAVRATTEHEAREQAILRATEDFREGVRAVAERRPGNWQGR